MMTCGLDKFFIISHSPALWLFSIRQDHRESCADSLCLCRSKRRLAPSLALL